MWVFVESHPIKNLSSTILLVSPVLHRKEKKMKEKCSEGLSYACSLSARIVTRLYDALIVYCRMIAPRHTRICDLANVDFAPLYTLYRCRPTLETPLFHIDPFNLTGLDSSPRARLNCARGKAFPLSRFSERDSFSRTRHPLVNTFVIYPSSMCILSYSWRVFEATN